MKLTRVLCALGALGCLVLPMASTANAAFVVSSPGLMCVEDNDTTPEIRYSFGSAFNASSATETYNCPMTVYNPTAAAFSGSVTVKDNTQAGGFSCAVRACTSDGQTCNFSTAFTTSAAFTGFLSSPFLGVSGGFSGGYAYMRCSVPASSGGIDSAVVSVRWLE